MASSSSSHRPTQSIGTGLQLPGQAPGRQQRRMTSPAGSLGPPDGGRRPSPRPPSPLRNGYVMDTSTGIDPHESEDGSDEDDDDDDDHAKWQRSPSPSSSVSHLAASFVQRVNNFVGGIAPPRSPGVMPTDAELEAEAERERDLSRREAEAILTREAHQRKLVEERVLAMVESTKSLPPPPSRAQTMPNPPSPSNSQKDSNWWTAAKNKLTPTKDLTPAQQIIQETKVREKEQKKVAKEKEKEEKKAKENEWPAKPETKYSDPAFANLNIPIAPPTRKPVPQSPSSPTRSRPSLSNMPPNLTPSPMRATDTISSSPSREAPPLYAQFNAQGTLDVPGTLLAIAKRFEKLEKWTVGHVRALEDRMNDVERWLVDKEKEKEETASMKAKDEIKESPSEDLHHEVQEIREEVSELQGRVGELGREMAKLATSPSNLSNGPKSQAVAVTQGVPTTSSAIAQQHTGSSIPSTPHHARLNSATAQDSTSPPMASSRRTPSGTRLPYPQGDYTSPPDAFSPPSSPPGSISTSTRPTISGLPNTRGLSSSASSTSLSSAFSYGQTTSPTPMSAAVARAISPTPSGNGLPPPKASSQRQSSISPTPRKRYTVALGGPIVAPDELSSNAAVQPEPPRRTGTPKSFAKPSSSIESAFFSGNGNGNGNSNGNGNRNKSDDDDDDENEFGGETIGKSAASRLTNSASFAKGDYKSPNNDNSPSPMSSRRIRAQSAYGFSSIPGASGTTAAAAISGNTSANGLPSVAPLRPKLKSKSSERLNSSFSSGSLGSASGSGTGDGMVSALGGTGRFVDPLVLRRQSKDGMKPIAMPKPIGKVPIGQLVAFFDGDKK